MKPPNFKRWSNLHFGAVFRPTRRNLSSPLLHSHVVPTATLSLLLPHPFRFPPPLPFPSIPSPFLHFHSLSSPSFHPFSRPLFLASPPPVLPCPSPFLPISFLTFLFSPLSSPLFSHSLSSLFFSPFLTFPLHSLPFPLPVCFPEFKTWDIWPSCWFFSDWGSLLTVPRLLQSSCGIRQTIIVLSCGFFFLLLHLLFFPRLISAVADWMSAILPHMVWP